MRKETSVATFLILGFGTLSFLNLLGGSRGRIRTFATMRKAKKMKQKILWYV